MASTAFSMLANAVTMTTASLGNRELSVSSRLKPDSAPSFRSTSARSKCARSKCRSASGTPVASSTECFAASRAIRRVFRIFASSSTIRIRMGGSQKGRHHTPFILVIQGPGSKEATARSTIGVAASIAKRGPIDFSDAWRGRGSRSGLASRQTRWLLTTARTRGSENYWHGHAYWVIICDLCPSRTIRPERHICVFAKMNQRSSFVF